MRSTAALVTYLEDKISRMSTDLMAMNKEKKKNEYQKGFIACEKLEIEILNEDLKKFKAIQPKRRSRKIQS